MYLKKPTLFISPVLAEYCMASAFPSYRTYINVPPRSPCLHAIHQKNVTPQ